MPRTKEKNSAIRAEKRQLIMDSAMQLFAEQGYEHTSIDSIARHAGISKGLLYAYFKSKDDLLYHILSDGLQKIETGYSPEMTMDGFLESADKILSHILENKQFFKLYTILSMQPKITRKLGDLASEYHTSKNIVALFRNNFGEAALQEIMLVSVIFKGFPILVSFDDQQDVFPVDALKNVIMDFLKERYGLDIRV